MWGATAPRLRRRPRCGPAGALRRLPAWAGAQVASDPLATALAGAGVPAATLESWLEHNPAVTLGGQTDKVFDLTEEMGAEAVMELVRDDIKGGVAK